MPPLEEKLREAERMLADGLLWEARDCLHGLRATHGFNPALFDLMARTALAMGDKPAAGACYFLTGAPSNEAVAAVEAFRRRCGRSGLQMALRSGFLKVWEQLPDERLRALREEFGDDLWSDLRVRHRRRYEPLPIRPAGTVRADESPNAPTTSYRGWGLLVIFALLFCVFAAIGFGVVFVLVRDAIRMRYF